uniref:Signaling protein n=1 Tax=Clostridioides difficile TaxID=1496 RepID=A0A381IB73_CLODI|nr:signaling protein [Clostridioides difficile]
MDDFGSGYSSLNMLKEIPMDILKLDQKFIMELIIVKEAK